MDFIRTKLLERLKEEKAFWSYEPVDEIEDDDLIELVLIHLDLEDIERLFLIFPKNRIRRIWKERLIKQEPWYHNLNVFLAGVYFGIKSPQKYIARVKEEVKNF